ncbi:MULTISPECIES: class I ribonucleotide reductase maintenance protein YfaE [unclassified Oceanobacter]|uniref:class I ribonucleotide reductase maintenance protein YfaE n=2 Tax=Gammaproteobacteria TaxID=1236 RepID=UPI0027328806|nr:MULTISPECIES: class I ribonucleotide reductase maintenance protein YfaE [unclassified Oceanobacter]MDP2608778.1 class I ribonucleotide reductase maintenance protein YfaE [Oceanobacter sp. 1_MG-2023]MDP2611980.1 class I ribonucleotide reductase maintenance protein YfaE [Oceanobacter sp. 2_MG-2023]
MSQPPESNHQDLSSSANDSFELDGNIEPDSGTGLPPFELEPPPATSDSSAQQVELYLPERDPEQPEQTPQLELEGMAPPVFAITLDDGHQARFQYAANLLESLEAQQIDVHFQCREGYCGSCRAQLLSGEVHYANDPLAWLNEGEILLCCCIPRSDVKIKL